MTTDSAKLRIINLDGLTSADKNVWVEIQLGAKKLKTAIKSTGLFEEDFQISDTDFNDARDVKFVAYNDDKVLGAYSVEIGILLKYLTSKPPYRIQPSYELRSDTSRNRTPKPYKLTVLWSLNRSESSTVNVPEWARRKSISEENSPRSVLTPRVTTDSAPDSQIRSPAGESIEEKRDNNSLRPPFQSKTPTPVVLARKGAHREDSPYRTRSELDNLTGAKYTTPRTSVNNSNPPLSGQNPRQGLSSSDNGGNDPDLKREVDTLKKN